MERVQAIRHDLVADAAKLRALLVPGDPLILANVWDPASAKVVESAGLRAIATASAAIAPVNGYEDHGKLPPDVAFGVLLRICDAVKLPVTADLEDGYGLSAEDLVTRIVDAGACGLNLEDTDHRESMLIDANRQAQRIAAIKAAARGRGVDLVINARIDAHLHKRPEGEGLERAQKYFEAGADCVYPIFLADASIIRKYAALGRTNVLCIPGGLPMRELIDAGVARISVGPLLHHFVLKQLRSAAEALGRCEDKGWF